MILCSRNHLELDDEDDASFSSWFWIQSGSNVSVLYDESSREVEACVFVLFANFLGPPVWENLVNTKSVAIKNTGPNTNKSLLGNSFVVIVDGIGCGDARGKFVKGWFLSWMDQ